MYSYILFSEAPRNGACWISTNNAIRSNILRYDSSCGHNRTTLNTHTTHNNGTVADPHVFLNNNAFVTKRRKFIARTNPATESNWHTELLVIVIVTTYKTDPVSDQYVISKIDICLHHHVFTNIQMAADVDRIRRPETATTSHVHIDTNARNTMSPP